MQAVKAKIEIGHITFELSGHVDDTNTFALFADGFVKPVFTGLIYPAMAADLRQLADQVDMIGGAK
ncbi:MAG: hypothetical protein JKY31_13110 [Rhodobacteraceae bacterium]|nr:hypothetical protein [Paracoccaceae bacterium]